MLQYEDLQCPICKRYTDDAFPAVVNEYVKPGRLQLDFRGLAFLGPDSEKALRIALAAGKQNKLWDVVGLFYANQGEENSGWVTDAKIDEILAQVPGLDVAKVKKDAESAAITKEMQDMAAEATQNAVQGTPRSSSRGASTSRTRSRSRRSRPMRSAPSSTRRCRDEASLRRVGPCSPRRRAEPRRRAGGSARPARRSSTASHSAGRCIGQKSATVTLIQFEDLGCTHCKTYMEEAFPTIVRDYVRTGLVKVDFRGLGVVTRASEPALRYTLAASRQKKLWQVAELFYEKQRSLNELATDTGVKRLVKGIPGIDPVRLVADAKSPSVSKQAPRTPPEADRRNVPGRRGSSSRSATRRRSSSSPTAYDGEAFSAILDDALGR